MTADRLISNPGSRTWEEFSDVLRSLVRALPADLRPEHHINDLPGFGSMDRVALRTALVHILGGVPDDLVTSIETLDEAFQWWSRSSEPFASGGRLEPSRDNLNTSSVRLRPIEPRDLERLYQGAISPRSAYRWRFRGATPSPAEFKEHLYSGSLVQFVVEGAEDGKLHGLVTAYGANTDSGHAYIGFYRASAPDVDSGGQMTEGICLLIDYLFRTWTFLKLYCELPDYNLGFLTDYSATIVQEEGCLRNHLYHDGKRHDMHIVAIYREPFMELAESWWAVLQS